MAQDPAKRHITRKPVQRQVLSAPGQQVEQKLIARPPRCGGRRQAPGQKRREPRRRPPTEVMRADLRSNLEVQVVPQSSDSRLKALCGQSKYPSLIFLCCEQLRDRISDIIRCRNFRHLAPPVADILLTKMKKSDLHLLYKLHGRDATRSMPATMRFQCLRDFPTATHEQLRQVAAKTLPAQFRPLMSKPISELHHDASSKTVLKATFEAEKADYAVNWHNFYMAKLAEKDKQAERRRQIAEISARKEATYLASNSVRSLDKRTQQKLLRRPKSKKRPLSPEALKFLKRIRSGKK